MFDGNLTRVLVMMREGWIMGAELRWLSGWWNYGEDMAVWHCLDE